MSNAASNELAGEWYLGVYCRKCQAPVPVFRDPGRGVAVTAGTGKLTVACPRCGKKAHYAAREVISFLVYAEPAPAGERAPVNDDQPIENHLVHAAPPADHAIPLTPDAPPAEAPPVLELGPELAVEDAAEPVLDLKADPTAEVAPEPVLDLVDEVLELEPEAEVEKPLADDDTSPMVEDQPDAEPAPELPPGDMAVTEVPVAESAIIGPRAVETSAGAIAAAETAIGEPGAGETSSEPAVLHEPASRETDVGDTPILEAPAGDAPADEGLAGEPVVEPEPDPAVDVDAAPDLQPADEIREPEPEPDGEAISAVEIAPAIDDQPAAAEMPELRPGDAPVLAPPVGEISVSDQPAGDAPIADTLVGEWALIEAPVVEAAAAEAEAAPVEAPALAADIEPPAAEPSAGEPVASEMPVTEAPAGEEFAREALVVEAAAAAAGDAPAVEPSPHTAADAEAPPQPPADEAPAVAAPRPVEVAAPPPAAPKPVARVYRERWAEPARRPQVIAELRPILRALHARAEATRYDVLARVAELFLDYLDQVPLQQQSATAVEQYINAVFALAARGPAGSSDAVGEAMAASLRALNRRAGLYIAA